MTSGELVSDEFSSYPPECITSLAPTVLNHWGLLASPFDAPRPIAQRPHPTEFYFRGDQHVAAWHWLQNLVRRPACLGMLTTSTGVGTSALLRHLATTSGLGRTAIETATAEWGNQSLVRFIEDLNQTAGGVDTVNSVRTVWMVDVAPACQVSVRYQRAAALKNWYQTNAHNLSNLTVVMVIRRNVDHVRLVSNATHSIPSHHLARWSDHELVRCIGASLRQAGSTRPAFTVAATARLAEAAEGSVSRLGRLVHAALLHGYLAGLLQISRKDLGGRLHEEIRFDHSAAQRRTA